MTERLQKILSAHGVASRRESEKMLLDGRVTVNGITATLGQSADARLDVIAVDGARVEPVEEKVYIMLNKPRGYVTTMRDEKGRRSVASLVTGCGARVFPAGRLDMNSEGLLLMTSDGDFAYKVTHPSFEKEKTYHVRFTGDANRAAELMGRPMEIDSYAIRPAVVKLLSRTETGGVLSVTIHEGRNRQVRKMCEKCGLTVVSLTRVSLGGLTLGRLRTGRWRYLTDEEVERILRKRGK